ncbi:hypothetical protein LCGC14_2289080, partial [marine sediment metagenome]
ELQASVGNDLVRLEFLRNMRLGMRLDFKVLYTAAHHLESLTERQFSYLKRIRSLYSPQELVAVGRALSPDSETPTNFSELVLEVTKTRLEVHRGEGNPKRSGEDPDLIEGESSSA